MKEKISDAETEDIELEEDKWPEDKPRLASPKRRAIAPGSQAGSSARVAGSAAPSSPRPLRVAAPSVEPTAVAVKRSQLNAAVDGLRRAQKALRNAARVATAAAESFAQEAEVLSETKASLEALRDVAFSA